MVNMEEIVQHYADSEKSDMQKLAKAPPDSLTNGKPLSDKPTLASETPDGTAAPETPGKGDSFSEDEFEDAVEQFLPAPSRTDGDVKKKKWHERTDSCTVLPVPEEPTKPPITSKSTPEEVRRGLYTSKAHVGVLNVAVF